MTQSRLFLHYVLSTLIDKVSSSLLFHTVAKHGMEQDTTILASNKSLARAIRRCQNNFTAVVQDTYPWIKDSDIFAKPREEGKVILGMHRLLSKDETETKLDDFFGSFKEEFPSFSEFESNHGRQIGLGGKWATATPTFQTPPEEIDTHPKTGTETYPLHNLSRKNNRSNRINKKARMQDSSQNGYDSGQLSDSDGSANTRKSRLRQAKLCQSEMSKIQYSPTHHLNFPPLPKKPSNTSIASQAIQSITQAFSPTQISASDRTTPSSLTEINVETIQIQQQEIASLQENLFYLQQSVQDLQATIQEQSVHQGSLSQSLEDVQNTLQDHTQAQRPQ